MLGQSIKFVNASDAADFEQAFVNLVEWRVGVLIVSNDAFFNSMRERIVALAARHRIPAIYDRRENATVGGLLSYGTSGLPRRQNNALADSVEKLRPHL